MSKKRKGMEWGIKVLLSIIFAFSIFAKIFGAEMMVANMTRYGFGGKVLLIGVAELIVVILFYVPRTCSVGVLLLSAHMGGAIATHMQHGEAYLLQSIVLILVWTAGIANNPALVGRLFR